MRKMNIIFRVYSLRSLFVGGAVGNTGRLLFIFPRI